MLRMRHLAQLGQGVCPDCEGTRIVPGPQGGAGRNVACADCGSEFNIARFEGRVVLGHRNSKPGEPDLRRLAEVFKIVLEGEGPEMGKPDDKTGKPAVTDTQVTERMTDAQRQLLLVVVSREWARLRYDLDMQPKADELHDLVAMLSGTDTAVVVERAYPSRRA